ncbi:hypothetical protein ACHAP5_010474 [Fusarium lateritium]
MGSALPNGHTNRPGIATDRVGTPSSLDLSDVLRISCAHPLHHIHAKLGMKLACIKITLSILDTRFEERERMHRSGSRRCLAERAYDEQPMKREWLMGLLFPKLLGRFLVAAGLTGGLAGGLTAGLIAGLFNRRKPSLVIGKTATKTSEKPAQVKDKAAEAIATGVKKVKDEVTKRTIRSSS